jgi:hypothetical protein
LADPLGASLPMAKSVANQEAMMRQKPNWFPETNKQSAFVQTITNTSSFLNFKF